jgi:hypothetical protein
VIRPTDPLELSYHINTDSAIIDLLETTLAAAEFGVVDARVRRVERGMDLWIWSSD